MSADEFTGPVDFAVFVVPRGADVAGAARQLARQVAAGTTSLLDVELLGLSEGEVVRLPLTTLHESEGSLLREFARSESDLLDDEDVAAVGAELQGDELAIVLVYEDRSLAPVAEQLSSQGGRLLWIGGVHADEVLDALEHTENLVSDLTEEA